MRSIRRPFARLAGAPLRAALPVVIAVVALGGTTAACSDGAHDPAWSQAPAAVTVEAEVPIGHMHMPTGDEVASTWQGRPEYVEALADAGRAAYRFALERPDVLQWLPCYCGCEGMEHRSNLDCFFQRREEKGLYLYEEHASYCDICIDTANLASEMLRNGSTMTEIRDAVDKTYGGGAAPGTDTPLPPEA